MGFITGFLYLTCHNEEIAFDMLCTLMGSYEISNLSNESLFHKVFYHMNKLIAIYLPKLHSHLFQEGLNASYFTSTWFLTAFTFILQYAKKKSIPLLLNYIFDGFLTVV